MHTVRNPQLRKKIAEQSKDWIATDARFPTKHILEAQSVGISVEAAYTIPRRHSDLRRISTR